MKEQFVTYEIALALKELGFDKQCLAYFRQDGTLKFILNPSMCTNTQLKGVNLLAAPLWQQAIDWFREEKDIHVNITPSFNFELDIIDGYNISDIYNSKTETLYMATNEDDYDSYYKAREQAILKAIELCKNN